MKSPTGPQSATSLPPAPRDAVGARSTRYLLMMGVRVACFILMVVITPYGWYTWVLGAGAVFIPYIAVVLANVGADTRRPEPENPERALPAAPTVHDAPAETPVIRIAEAPRLEPGGGQPSSPPDPLA